MVQQYINDKFVSVAAASVVVLEANLNRVAYTITNPDGTINISLSKGTVAVDKKGTYLPPKGAIAECSDGTFYCWTGPVSAIGDAAGPVSLSISEVIQVDQ